MAVINIKFTKFDNTPWGFRLAGGSDFPQPLTVIRVTEESLAECMGLKVGDIVVRLNDEPISSLTHGQAHEELMRAGNNFVLGIQRGEESLKAVEALSDENIVPYKIPLAELPPVFPEQILIEETVIEQYEETIEEKQEEEVKPEVEPLPDKPKDANSEVVPNQNLTDDEIAQLILEEEELLNDKGVLGVNFKKLRPRAPILKQSKVIEELQNIATAEPPLVEQLRRTSVFLQKPERPVPQPKKKQEEEVETAVETYKVVIKKQQRRSITDRLLASGLLKPEDAKTPEPPTPEVNMDSNEPEARIEEDDSSTPTVDDSPCSHQEVEPIVVCSSACVESLSNQSPLCIETNCSLELEGENSMTNVDDIEPSKREENIVLARRPNKRRFKRYYTKAHYFRKCFFGKRGQGEGKKAARVKSSFKERFQENDELEERARREKSSRSRTKDRYLETYSKPEDHSIRCMADDSVSSGKISDKLSSSKVSLRRTRYAEKILARSVQLVVVNLHSDVLKFLEREQPTDVANSGQKSSIRKRLYLKGRYFERSIFRLLNNFKGTSLVENREIRNKGRRRSSGMIKMRGRYLEKFLLENDLFNLNNRSSDILSKRRVSQTHYGERIVKQNFENLYYTARQVLQGISDLSLDDLRSYLLQKENGGLFSNLIRSSKDLVSNEVFHRGSRRLSRSRGSVSADSSRLQKFLTNCGLDFDWLMTKFVGRPRDGTVSEKKMMQDNERDGRRLSFVPTVLYEGLTNRIGVDFTRLVAYMFVPCTSIILLYMYK